MYVQLYFVCVYLNTSSKMSHFTLSQFGDVTLLYLVN